MTIRTFSPYICAGDAPAAIEFYKKAFNATELMRYDDNGKVGHAELKIGDALLMIASDYEEMHTFGVRTPESLGGSSVHFFLLVDEIEALVEQAVKAGANVLEPVRENPHSGRKARLRDPYGYMWSLITEA